MARGRRKRYARFLAALAAGVLAASVAGPTALRHVRAVGLLLGVTGAADPTGITRLLAYDVDEHDAPVRAGTRTLRARVYAARGLPRAPGTVLLHGVHRAGIDEPHLRDFARGLAALGARVLTPELPELLDYRVEPSTLDDIEACVWQHARTTGGPVGVWGISFAGGLALIAAARPGAERAFDHVVAVGGHHDLVRLARYYAGEAVRGPDGARPRVRPHAYGARVILHAHAESFFAPDDLPGARRALRLYLSGQSAAARVQARALSPPAHALMTTFLDEGREREVGRHLMRAVREHQRDLARVSPRGQLAGLRTPVFLVHGDSDPVIPSLETLHLAREVPPRALRRALVTPVLRHTDAKDTPSLAQHWELVRFVAAVIEEAAD